MTAVTEAFTVLPPAGSEEKAKTFFGPFREHVARLRGYNEMGFGVFFTVNGTDGFGRRIENVRMVRSLFADYDNGLPAKWALEPNMLVESSPGRFQAYWHIGEPSTDLARWGRIMRSLVESTGADRNAQDLARIFRVPGFLNHKYTPSWQVAVKMSHGKTYNLDDAAAAFGESTTAPVTYLPPAPLNALPPEPERLKRWLAWLSYRGWPSKGDRNGWLYRAAAAGIRDFAVDPDAVEVTLESMWYQRETDDPKLDTIMANARRSSLRGVGCAYLPAQFNLQEDEDPADEAQ